MRFGIAAQVRTNWLSKIFAIGLLLLAVLAINPKLKSSTLLSGQTLTRPTDNSLASQLDTIQSYVSPATKSHKPLIYSKQYVLLDAETSEVIVSSGADTPIPIASTTKMTTALVALNELPLDRVVTISGRPPLVQGSKIGLRAGESITVRNLIQGLLIYSSNDSAFALAEAFANQPGDYQKFVGEMNDFARQHHLINTVYGDPAGLDDLTGRSTARELANVARLLLREPFLAQTVSTPELNVTSVDGQIIHQLKNTNRLILPDNPLYLPNALGVKTGFTLDAGHSLVAAYSWQGRLLIGVVMNTIESTITASAQEMNKLFRWADESLVLREY